MVNWRRVFWVLFVDLSSRQLFSVLNLLHQQFQLGSVNLGLPKSDYLSVICSSACCHSISTVISTIWTLHVHQFMWDSYYLEFLQF